MDEHGAAARAPRDAVAAPEPVKRPDARAVPCDHCAQSTDLLRAARVAIFHDQFHYFCSASCREAFVPSSAPPPRAPISSTRPHLPPPPLLRARATPIAEELQPAAAAGRAARARVPISSVFGLATFALSLSAFDRELPWLTRALACAACASFCIELSRSPDVSAERRLWLGVAPLGATLAALATLWFQPGAAPAAVSVAGLVCAVAGAARALGQSAHERGAPERDRVAAALAGGDARTAASSTGDTLKPGQEFVLELGQVAPADAVVLAGRARILPWAGARVSVARQDGDALLAGASVIEGALKAMVRWGGDDRAWARLSRDPKRRADRHSSWAKLAERASTSLAVFAGLSGWLIAIVTGHSVLLGVSHAAAAFSALANVAIADLVALSVARGVARLLAIGAVFQGPGALDRASRVGRAVFCADGTLLSGELEVASIEPSTGISGDELLALASGAFTGTPGAVPHALARSARAHQVRPDATRSPNFMAGLGVTAVASSGRALIVGTRALLLQQRVSVASAETRIAELEALGRSVLLVALDNRWVGLIALQDDLAPGARAAVQRLLDAGIEPVFLSGEARETCRALARTLGIDHVRPEVLPEARAEEIKRLSQIGAPVAVIGRGPLDDTALGAAQLSINIDARTGPLERWDVDIASGEVKDAALALALTRELERDSERALWKLVTPAAAALVLLLVGAPAWLAPLLGFGGCLLAWQGLQGEQGDQR